MKDKKTEALELALEVSEEFIADYQSEDGMNSMKHYAKKHHAVLTASRAALAEQPAQQQEPVAFSQFLSDVVTAAGLLSHGKTDKSLAARISEFAFRLRTSPPASKPWVGLTEDERTDICEGYGANIHWRAFRAIEAKLREKNAQPSKPLTEDEAVSAVSSVLPVTSTGGQRHYFQIQRKYALEITRAIEAAHGITGEQP